MKFFIASLLVLIFAEVGAQNDTETGKVYTLTEIINIARRQSIASKFAETTRENRFWQYQTYKSNYKPQLALEGTIPEYRRAFSPITQEDGTIQFRPIQNNSSILGLSIEQPIGISGATVFLNSDLSRFDNFLESDNLQIYHQYSGTPLEVGIIQPLFRFNDLRWDKKIEPLRFEESQKEYFQDLEEISLNTTNRFFDLMLAQIQLQIAEKNVANNDTIFKIAQGRYNLGKIAENELLQLELQLMNSRQQAAEAALDIETRTLRLKTWVGLPEASELVLFLPEEIPDFTVDEVLALKFARANRAESIGFERRLLEAEADVARAKGETGPQADLVARFGLTNSSVRDGQIDEIYDNPRDQQFVRLGFQIPILDWGRRKSRVKTAEANQKMVQYTVDQEIINFDEEVLTQVRQIQMLKDQIKITKVADDIAQRRYDITKNRYNIGKISITDMNIALTEKDAAKQNYIQSLRDFWQAYFNLRLLTLYDFEQNNQIITDEL
jgi:outer membrane protein